MPAPLPRASTACDGPSPTGSAGGSSVAQRGRAAGQRGWKRHPAGQAVGAGTVPAIGVRRVTAPVIRGTEARRPFVYGWDGRAKSSAVVASSTSRPAYITATRSARPATMPRSCVMRSTAMPRAARRPSSSSRIWACTVTSSAVVGSSAMSISGSEASAMAIITRWRMPPLIWCG